jgi:hypothetical protein
MLEKAARAMTVFCLLAVSKEGEGAMKVYISADMEGVTGVVSGDQLGPEVRVQRSLTKSSRSSSSRAAEPPRFW